MEVPAAARALADDLARALGIEGLAFDDDGTLTLELDGRLVLSMGVEPDDQGLVLFSPVTPGPAGEVDLLRRALEANFLWRATEGATLAVEPTSGQLALQRRLPLAGLDYPAFAAALEAFAEQAGVWTETAAAGRRADEAEVRVAQPPPYDPRMLA